MRSFWSLSLQRQLAIAVGLLLVPVVSAAIWSGMSTFRERATELGDQTRLVAYTTATYINRDLAYLDGTAANLVANPDIRVAKPSVSEDLLRRITAGHSTIMCIELVRRSGEVVAHAMTAGDGEELRAPGTEWATAVFDSGKRVVSPLYVGSSGARYVVLAYPVRDDMEQIVAALAFFVDLRTLQDSVGGIPVPNGSVVNVVDRDGRLLARSEQPERYVGQLLPADLRPGDFDKEPAERTGIDGVRRIYGEAKVDDAPWVVSVGIPMSLARNRAASLWARSFAILAFGLAGWLIVAFGLSRRLANSLAHLETAAQRIGAGDFTPVERRPMPTREFAELQDAFDLMLRRFNDTRSALDGQMARGAAHARRAAIIAATGDPAGAAGRGRPARVGRGARNQQSAAGDSRLCRIAADAGRRAGLGQSRSAADSEGERARVQDHPQPGDVRAAAAGRGGASTIGRRHQVACAELRQRRLQSEQIELRIEDRSTLYVSAVFTELQQVMLNFVVNAEQAILRSGRLPGRITIRACDIDGRVLLEVEDTGPGIPRR